MVETQQRYATVHTPASTVRTRPGRGRRFQKGATMAVPNGPAGGRPRSAFRLTSGFDVLDKWMGNASQIEKNRVHQVLFAVADRSVFTHYEVVDDVKKTMEFFVFARSDLTVKIRVHGLDAFGIIYVGPSCEAPGLDAAPEQAADPEPGLRRAAQEPGAGREGSTSSAEQDASHLS
jgi:Family of unknown function (DUF6235)